MDDLSSTTPSPRTRQPLPLSMVFEGQCWRLTTLLHSTIAIWLISWLEDRDQYVYGVNSERGTWTHELFYYLGAIGMGAFTAGLAVGVLSLNLRPVNQKTWRARICRSVFALMFIDFMAIDSFLFALRVILHAEAVASIPAAVFLVFSGLCFVINVNVMHINMYGCCLCMQCRENAYDDLTSRERFTELCGAHQRVLQPRAREAPEAPDSLTESNDVPHRRVTFSDDGEPQSSSADITKEIELPETSSMAPIRDPLPEKSTIERQSSLRNPSTIETQASIESKAASTRMIRRWDTMKLVEDGTTIVHTHLTKRPTRSKSQASEIIEEPPTGSERVLRHSRRSSIAPDVFGIISRFLRKDDADAEEKPFDFNQFLPRHLWDAVREELHRFRYAVWIKSALLTSVIVLLYSYIRTISVIAGLSDHYLENRLRFNSNLHELNSFLKNAGWLNGIDDVRKTLAVELFLIADAVIPDLRYTVWAGYTLGIIVGLYSLVTVLIQHKRMSLAVSDGLTSFRMARGTNGFECESPWPAFQKKYPMLEASYFLAILSSTAVLQLHIVGMTVSILLGLLMNVAKLEVILHLVGFYILAYVIVFAIDWLTMRFLKRFLISEDGAHIIHPRWFNFTIVVLSMVHLVLSLLYAMWRMLYMMAATVVVLNRLDISLFATGKKYDNGHNAFMSMLVLTVLIQEDHESFIVRTHSQPSQVTESMTAGAV